MIATLEIDGIVAIFTFQLLN